MSIHIRAILCNFESRYIQHSTMKDIKLIINEYGPLKNAELSFAPMMVFTGDSNLGKSYVNYLWYYFMSSFDHLVLSEFISSKFVFKKEVEEFSFRKDELRLWINKHAESFLQKLLNDNSLICDVNFIFELEDKINIRLEQNIKRNEDDTEDYVVYKVIIGEEYSSVYPSFFDPDDAVVFALGTYLKRSLFGRSYKPVILPPARGSLVGENFSIKDKVSRSSGLYANFLQDYDFALRSVWRINNDEQFFSARIKKLLGGELVTKEGVQYLELASGRMIPLSAAASSIRELAPLMFYLKNHYGQNVSFCLEEPEAHLHPKMQVDIADMLAICLNRGYMFQITTHSDYMIQRINQLIKLGRLRMEDISVFEEYAQSKGLNKDTYLDKNNIKGYYFSRGADNSVDITELDIMDDGVPMSTFFDIVTELSVRENDIDRLLHSINPDE